MNKKTFNSLKEIITVILKSNCERNLSSVIGFEYFSDESNKFIFDETLDKYAFFFQFLDIYQRDLNNTEFEEVINKLYNIDLNDLLLIKKIIYYKELKTIKNKFNKGLIDEKVFNQLNNEILKN